MGSVGTRNPAPPPVLGQLGHEFRGGSQLEGDAEIQSAGRSGLLWPCWLISAHGSPLGSGRSHGSLPSDRRHGRPSQALDPTQDRGTATSASWITPEQAADEAIARIKQILSE
jgi:hypothetical protein